MDPQPEALQCYNVYFYAYTLYIIYTHVFLYGVVLPLESLSLSCLSIL